MVTNCDMRAHFAGMIRTVGARLQQNERETAATVTREQRRVTLRGEATEAMQGEGQAAMEENWPSEEDQKMRGAKKDRGQTVGQTIMREEGLMNR